MRLTDGQTDGWTDGHLFRDCLVHAMHSMQRGKKCLAWSVRRVYNGDKPVQHRGMPLVHSKIIWIGRF